MAQRFRHRTVLTTVTGSLVVLAGLWFGLVPRSAEVPETYTELASKPRLSPDYTDVVLPPNIAPVNFRILEEGQQYVAQIHGDQGPAIVVGSAAGQIRIPPNKWRALLKANKGTTLVFDIYVKEAEHGWIKYQSLSNTIATEAIDDTVVYRRMLPIYNWWQGIGIYQRQLAAYDESLLMHGRSFGQGCINCHSFVGQAPETMTLGLRSGPYGSSTLLARNGAVRKIGAKWGYTAWHPSGTVAVYSINKVRQFFHTGRLEVRDVVDLDSALVCYRVEDHRTVSPPPLSDKDRLETYPAWSPDGTVLYFCSAPVLWQDRNAVPPENYDQVKYDLCRISYDARTDTWGQVETVLSAADTGLSILLPRVSPDGRFLLFCMCRYGCFPVYQPSSDLYMMDLATGRYERLDVNSEYAESWHSWSSNSRWIAFSSKRQGGLFTRTYFSYVDDQGRASKPFVLPQRDPTYYDALLETYSVPELIKGRVKVSRSALGRAARGKDRIGIDLPLTGATPEAKAAAPWQERE